MGLTNMCSPDLRMRMPSSIVARSRIFAYLLPQLGASGRTRPRLDRMGTVQAAFATLAAGLAFKTDKMRRGTPLSG